MCWQRSAFGQLPFKPTSHGCKWQRKKDEAPRLCQRQLKAEHTKISQVPRDVTNIFSQIMHFFSWRFGWKQAFLASGRSQSGGKGQREQTNRAERGSERSSGFGIEMKKKFLLAKSRQIQAVGLSLLAQTCIKIPPSSDYLVSCLSKISTALKRQDLTA